jgi:hypothetical protein
MARTILVIEQTSAPTFTALLAAVNTAIATLLDKEIVSINIWPTDHAIPQANRSIQVAIEYQDGGAVQSAPFILNLVQAPDATSFQTQVRAFLTANAALFISPLEYTYTDQLQNVANRYLGWYFTCVDAVNGPTNFLPK